jgi:hypothetical protein
LAALEYGFFVQVAIAWLRSCTYAGISFSAEYATSFAIGVSSRPELTVPESRRSAFDKNSVHRQT